MTIALPYVAVLLFVSLVAVLHTAGKAVDQIKRTQIDRDPAILLRAQPATS